VKEEMTQLVVNSIYMATEGEGIHIGTPQIFVRFQGCSIGCLNCDSKETWDFDAAGLSLEQVLNEVETQAGKYPYRIKRVSITGGDPLHPKHAPQVEALAMELKKRGYYINLEAAGTRVLDSLFDSIDFISFDFKTPSTGVKTNIKLLEKVFVQYASKAQIKSVIADKKDFEFTYDTYMSLQQKHEYSLTTPWVLTPCYEPGEEFPKERFIEVINFNEAYGSPFRVIGQQHKWIHGPNKQNV
jgi:7-carboxy-7-deazaguanine synthase